MKYKVLYYNIPSKELRHKKVFFNDYDVALTQFDILKDRYDYVALIDNKSNKIIKDKTTH